MIKITEKLVLGRRRFINKLFEMHHLLKVIIDYYHKRNLKKSAIIACILTLATIGCQKNSEYVVFSGKVENTTDTFVTIEGFGYEANIPIDADGSFADTLSIPENGIYDFGISTGKSGMALSTIFLRKNTSLTVLFDKNQFLDSSRINTTFEGSTSRENSYLRDKANLLRERFWENVYSGDRIYVLEEPEYIAAVEQINLQLSDLLTSTGTSREFQEMERRVLEYDRLNQLENYEFLHGVYTGNREYQTSDTFPKSSFLHYDEWSYKCSGSYQELISRMIRNNVSRAVGAGTPSTLAYLEEFEKIPNQYILNSVLNGFSVGVIVPNKHIDTAYEFYAKHSTIEDHKKEYQELYKKMKAITPGSKSPSFEYENVNGVTTTLDDLRGKYVYIDVWATWCAPCRAEIPHLKKLKSEFKNDNIYFVGISIDRDENRDKWKQMVMEEDLGELQFIADREFDSDFIKKYNIFGIPRFILLDTEGKIVSHNASRPSDPKLKDQLVSLLRG